MAALQDPNSSVVSNSAEALAALGDRRAIEPLTELLQHKSRMVKSMAVEGLARLGAVDLVVEVLLSADESRLRLKVAEKFHLLGGDGVEVLFLLRTLLDDDNGLVRRAAALALAQLTGSWTAPT